MKEREKAEENKTLSFPKFISNNPCGKDLFEGKSHETIAKCISEQLEAKENCNIIGLEGSWGSGKSNLVQLIKIELEKSKKTKYYMYTYDIWGYQNDYLRRSVLENLLTFLIKDDKGPKFSKDWNESLRRLLSRKETIGSRVVKEINFFTKISIYMFLFFELFTFVKDIFFKDFYDTHSWLKVVSSIIYFILYIAILIIFWNKNKKKFGEIPIPFIQWLSSSFYDFKNDTQNIEDSIASNSVYESEASTREFKDYIKNINNELKGNRLIIVFDNIDRLPVEKVKEVWSMINILFANDDTPNINIIVPFDRVHIISAFREENIDILTKKNIDGEYNVNQISYGNDFINKTFNIVFRVSPPTMSNWKTYFNNIWKDAFDEEVDYEVLQIYDLLTTDNQTPRKMIAFINEFVSIKKVFINDSIPNKYIALYIFGKEKIELNPDKEILSPTYLGALDFMYKEDSELSKYVSALYYQLDPKNSLDIIYTQSIIKALNNNDSDKLSEIYELPSFFQLLQNAITKITNFSNSIISLNKCFGEKSSFEIQHIWDCIYEQLSVKEAELQEYQDILLTRITNKKEYLSTIIHDFANSKEFDISKYYLALNHLLTSEGIDLPVKEYFIEKSVTPDEYVTFIELAKKDYLIYKVTCDINNFDVHLSKLSVEELKTLGALQYFDNKQKKELILYKESLTAKITEHNSDKEIITCLIERLKELGDPITYNISDASITSLFIKTKQEEDFYYDVICMRIVRLNAFQSNNSTLGTQILQNTEENFVTNLSKKIGFYISFSKLIENIVTMKSYPLYLAICKELILGDYKHQRASITGLLKNYKICKDNLHVKNEEIISKFNEWSDYKNDITIENITEIPIEFFNDGKEGNTEIYKHCILIANEYLELNDKEKWKQSIISKDYNYQLTVATNAITENCFEAFKELMNEKIQNTSISFDKESASQLINICVSGQRSLKALFNDIRDLFCSGNYTMTEQLFDFYGCWIFEYSDILKREESLRCILPTKILDKQCVISEMTNRAETIRKMITNSKEESQDFKNKLISLYASKNDILSSEFLKEIGIDVKNEANVLPTGS